VWFVVKGYRKQAPVMWMGLALAMIVWALNAGFSILAAPMAIRYLVFPYMVFAGFAAVVGDLFVRVSEEKERASVEENVESPQSTVHSPR
jgi:TRAP-type C4-dicarboxylate transport system permease small subunit